MNDIETLGKAIEWLLGNDTGVSSETILAVMVGNVEAGEVDSSGMRFGVPHDPSDFGRCHRLLEIFPEWRARLGEMEEIFPEWKPLVREWAKLTKLYLRDLPTGRCPELYDRMQELRKESLAEAGWTETSPGCWKKAS